MYVCAFFLFGFSGCGALGLVPRGGGVGPPWCLCPWARCLLLLSSGPSLPPALPRLLPAPWSPGMVLGEMALCKRGVYIEFKETRLSSRRALLIFRCTPALLPPPLPVLHAIVEEIVDKPLTVGPERAKASRSPAVGFTLSEMYVCIYLSMYVCMYLSNFHWGGCAPPDPRLKVGLRPP